MFTDKVTLELQAGKGGNGVVAWRKEKYIPKGGPSGGNGGRGGSIILEADSQVYSLESFRNLRLIKAEDGAAGGGGCRQGKSGQNRVLKVPLGTLVKGSNGEVLYDFTELSQRYEMLQGGKGGKGNNHFKSPTNRAPHECTMGARGQSAEVELELKLIADVGLVGLPNAGKSTLMGMLTDVPVKIAPYPFTTLRPNLGYIFSEEGDQILIADIPGIIAGASRNKGLGFEFLRHIERTNVLLFMIDISGLEGRDPQEDYETLLQELKAYNPELLHKPRAIALNKIDLEGAAEHVEAFKRSYGTEGVFEISAEKGEGLYPLIDFLKRKLKR